MISAHVHSVLVCHCCVWLLCSCRNNVKLVKKTVDKHGRTRVASWRGGSRAWSVGFLVRVITIGLPRLRLETNDVLLRALLIPAALDWRWLVSLESGVSCQGMGP